MEALDQQNDEPRVNISYASENELVELEKLIRKVIEVIPYYNELAKKSEIAKFGRVELLQKLREDPSSVIIATIDAAIVGFCLTRFDDNLIWIEWFGVATEFRGFEIGNSLLEAAEKTVLARSCHKIWCDTRTENLHSIRILTDRGYSQLATLKNHWYGQDFLLWEKPIVEICNS